MRPTTSRKNFSPPFWHLLLFQLMLIASSLYSGYIPGVEKNASSCLHYSLRFSRRGVAADEGSAFIVVLFDNPLRCLLGKEVLSAVLSQEKGKEPLKLKRRSWLLVFFAQAVGAWGGKQDSFFLFESYGGWINLQLLPDGSKHRDFLTVHGPRWLICQSFRVAWHDADGPSSTVWMKDGRVWPVLP